MKEKEKFGKKPVRRSTSDEKESARVYKPRTARPLSSKPQTEKYSNDEESTPKPTERRKSPDFKEKRERGDRNETKRQPRRDDKKSDSSRTYMPRTLKSKSIGKDAPKRERSDEDFEPRPEKRDSGKKSFYEDKYSKPKFERPTKEKFERPSRDKYTKSSSDRFSKPKSDRFAKPDKFAKPDFESKPKATKRFSTPPEIENELKTDKDGLIRLNKYIANSGLCSRREADEFIAKGQITVNGVEVRELGTKVKLTDEVRFKDKALDPEKKVYILLNKPKDYVTTVEDPNATRTVMDLIEGACEQRVYPVGRLDRNSTGLLLFTNDGELTKQLTHPSFMKRKVYEVGLDRNVAPQDMEAILKGLDFDGEIIAADAIEYADDRDKSIIGIEIHSGQNRIVRRMFEKLNYRVVKLDRVYFAGLTKKSLPRGKWRFLSAKEVNMLKTNRFK
ncbi:pseudouridine synthase [Perlabentimonas gracilis]|uniref:pseudouridine synthase n=1 Tax=Perlabentimonas gracilis TaxID=2715279 RepID=UPI00140DE832|nr:pseudouridine synthase [Perlabentimonas gracilis]NHB69471.1 pseudouridine synthase [Perlabentimonas gracilis]